MRNYAIYFIELVEFTKSETLVKAKNTEIRNMLPTDCLVTTYTYKPLVGMTSATDPSGKTTYYDYDDSGRLKTIKDDDENVLKEIKYKYATEQ